MADEELTGEAAALDRISSIVGAPDRPNTVAVVRKQGERDESMALRKAGFGKLQRALLLSPLAAAADRANRNEIRDRQLEMRDRDLAIRENNYHLREEMARLKLVTEETKQRDAQRELREAGEFMSQSAELDPRSPDFMKDLQRIKPIVSTETETGKTAERRYQYLVRQHMEYGRKLLPEIQDAMSKGYDGAVIDEDGNIDPWKSYQGLSEWAKAQEANKLTREDSIRQEKFEQQDALKNDAQSFSASQSDVAALRRQREQLEERMLEAKDDETKGMLTIELTATESRLRKALGIRDAATKSNTEPASQPATPATKPSAPEKIATNPTTGQKLVLRNGQWQPL